jgi:hypothetical protein
MRYPRKKELLFPGLGASASRFAIQVNGSMSSEYTLTVPCAMRWHDE